MNPPPLRPAQAEILTYENGRLAISAVPGSGKTFTLSLLAAQLIAWAHLDIAGTAFGDTEFGQSKNATGFGVRLLVEFMEKWANKDY